MSKYKLVAPLYRLLVEPGEVLPTTELEGGYIFEPFSRGQLTELLSGHESKYVSEYEREELETECQYAITYEYEADAVGQEYEDAQEDLRGIALCLRVIRQTKSIPYVFLYNETIQLVNAASFQSPLNVPEFPGPGIDMFFVPADMEKLKNYWSQVKPLNEENRGRYHKILNALILFNQAMHDTYPKTRLITLVTVLESIFNTSSEQVGLALRLKGSTFLASAREDIPNLTKDFQDIYTLRSNYVHGQGSSGALARPENLKRLFFRAEELTRLCLQKVLDNQLVSQFDNVRTLEEEFQKLIIGLPSALS